MQTFTDPCTSEQIPGMFVNNNSSYTYTLKAPPGERRFIFSYIAWEIDSAPPLNYIIDATVSATGETYHTESTVLPRRIGGTNFNSGGMTISLPYMTSFEFTLWNELRYKSLYNFTTAFSLPTGFKVQGRVYAYNDRCGVTYWFPSTEPMTLTITQGSEFASFYDKITGVKIGSTVTPFFSQISNLKLVVEDTPSEQIPLTIQVTGGSITKSQTTYIQGYPLDSFLVAVEPDSIRPGGETQVRVTPIDKNGVVLPSNHFFFLSTNDTNSSARLEMRYPQETGWSWVTGPANVPIRFHSQYTLQGYLYYIADTTKGASNRQITFSVKDTYNPKKTGTGSVIITGESALDHFDVRIEPDTILHNEGGKIFVTAKDNENNDFPLDGNTLINFSLDADGGRYGDLSYGLHEGNAINDIPYNTAKSGSVYYIAAGENPDSVSEIRIGVTGALKEGIGSAKVKTVIEKYCQTDYPNVQYDHYARKSKLNKEKDSVRTDGSIVYYSVANKGCTLTCMAMVAKAGGADTNPEKLAKYLIDSNGFDGNKVKWTAVNSLEKYSKFSSPISDGDGLFYDNNDKLVLSKSEPINLSSMDLYLSKKALIIAQVYNPSTKNNHWVLVTEKNGGKYSIIDPGCYNSRNDLESYNNNVYKIIIFRRK